MNKNDFKRFSEVWTDANELAANGKTLSPRAMVMVFEALYDYSLDDVVKALNIHIRKNKFAPTISDIVEIIEAGSPKHLGPDEAWSIALASFDEYDTVVMTREIQEARAIAYSVFMSGDEIGARMAFKDSYKRIILTAEAPVWVISEGFDKQRKVDAVKAAVALGRLRPDVVKLYELEPPKVSLAGLLEHAEEKVRLAAEDGKIVDEIVKAKHYLKNISDMLSGKQNDIEEGIAQREKERLEFEEHRQRMVQNAEKRISGG